MAYKRVFRVLISERSGFYVDVEADSHPAAMTAVRRGLDDPDGDMVPIENLDAYTGYQVEDALEIDRAVADVA